MPTKPLEDLTGKRFGMWTVTGYAGKATGLVSRSSRWIVVCDCGVVREASRGNLIGGLTKSCGRHRTGVRVLKHGYHGTTEHHIWTGMKQRCCNARSKFYKHYGGRGICVCERLMSFSGFISTMGNRPDGHSIDRIDNNGNYSCGQCDQCRENGWKENVRWATTAQQLRNRRVSRYIEHNGERLTVSEWAKRIGCSQQVINQRLKNGWSVRDAIERPVVKRTRAALPSGKRGH